MKNILYIFALILLATQVTACDSGDDPAATPDPLAEQTTLLMNGGSGWEAPTNAAVIKDGFDVSDRFQDFTLNFEDGTFETNNSLQAAWPASGTWEFVNDNPNQILRSDGVTMTVAVNGSNLTLTFLVSGLDGGRKASIDGEFQFNLISQ